MSSLSILLCIGLCTLGARSGKAQDKPANDKSLENMLSLVETIQFESGKGSTVPLERQGPVLRWSSPISPGIADALVFLWTDDGRPVVGGQLFKIGDSPWLHEFQSLSTQPLRATAKDQVFWSTEKAGLERLKVPAKFGKPASDGRRRLVQMRQIGRPLVAAHKVDRSSPTRLRLLSTPLYRYSSDRAKVVDGAVFSFAAGTDPEVLLIIEAIRPSGAEKEMHWEMSFAPMTIFACRVEREGKSIWSCDYRPPPHPSDADFHLYIFE